MFGDMFAPKKEPTIGELARALATKVSEDQVKIWVSENNALIESLWLKVKEEVMEASANGHFEIANQNNVWTTAEGMNFLNKQGLTSNYYNRSYRNSVKSHISISWRKS